MVAKNKLIMSTTAVLIVVVIVASFYFFILKPSSKPEIGISAPQGWSKLQDLNVAEGALGVQYQGTGTIEDAIVAFRTELIKAGWSHVRDETPQKGFTFSVLEKNDYEATIMVVETEPNKIIASIVVAKSKEETPKELELPKEDVAGEDLTDVPRFPSSVRTIYENYSESVSIEYLASANITAVTEYYAIELPANGWVLEGMVVGGIKTEIYAAKMERGFVTINIEDSDGYNGYVNVEVIFTPYY
ncbi:MAG: hypothetical protein QXP44_06415 [Candidatus Bathyarchaeia archaeon]